MTTQTEDKTYNGWTNYETWNCALWMDNERGTYDYWREVAGAIYRDAAPRDSFTKAEEASLQLMALLKDEIEEAAPDLGASMFADLLSAAMSEINWYEIASHLIEEVAGEA